MDIKKPQNIFELINANIVEISEDLNTMHQKIDMIYAALYPKEQNQPTENGNGSASTNE